MDLISIIIPVYDVEKYLRQCLDSVLAQTYQNIEVILVDDGSPDGCGAICDEYAEKYRNFTAVHKENAGLGMARNTGLEHVHGEYVMFLDSDDYIDSNLVEVLYKAIHENGVDVCKSGFRRVLDDGTVKSVVHYKDEVFSKDQAASDFMPRLIGAVPDKKDSFDMSCCASLYKVEPIRKHNIRFSSERELVSEDLIFNTQYAHIADGAAVVSFEGYNYRINLSSLTTTYKPERFENYWRMYFYLNDRLKEWGCAEETFVRLGTMQFLKVKKCVYQSRHAISHQKPLESISYLSKICNDERLKKIINKYPVSRLMFKRKVFVYMLKHKMSILLYLCAELNLLN